MAKEMCSSREPSAELLRELSLKDGGGKPSRGRMDADAEGKLSRTKKKFEDNTEHKRAVQEEEEGRGHEHTLIQSELHCLSGSGFEGCYCLTGHL